MLTSLAQRLAQARLYVIMDLGYLHNRSLRNVAAALAHGGADLVQLRGKHASLDELRRASDEIRGLLHEAGVPLIINDYPDLAAEVGADGVHVGQNDLTVAQARAIVGHGKIVGKSTHSLEQAISAASEEPDYIGVGPLFATPTKPDYVPVGLDLVRQVRRRVPALPQFCIGGVNRGTLPQVLAAGALRVVMVSGILLADDVETECRELRAMMDKFPIRF
jgi:thiamine-phosphate pyrophosphorylase